MINNPPEPGIELNIVKVKILPEILEDDRNVAESIQAIQENQTVDERLVQKEKFSVIKCRYSVVLQKYSHLMI